MSAAKQYLAAALAELKLETLTPADLIEVITDVMAERVGELDARLDALEKETEQRAYRGVFSTTERYAKHNSVTHDSSIWVAVETPRGSPPGNGWQLAMRRPKDARP